MKLGLPQTTWVIGHVQTEEEQGRKVSIGLESKLYKALSLLAKTVASGMLLSLMASVFPSEK